LAEERDGSAREYHLTDEAFLREMRQLSPVTAPAVQLLMWLEERSRTYAETMEAWKTSCPRLAVWEDALADGLIRIEHGSVLVTAAGKDVLRRRTSEDASR
jgi:hypothetical protein